MRYPSIKGYEIIDVLGEGGMGVVYLARQVSLDRKVAVKVLPSHLTKNEFYISRFHQEAKSAASIRHNGIVQIYDAGENDGLCYFAMEYVDGETTNHRIRRKGRIDEKSALLIGESVATALAYAWREVRLVHRDLKPDNILIDEDGTVKVVDLGLAKLPRYSSTAITLSRMMIGTPYYCAPEQARGEGEVDFRSDIYSLGATLYHFLTGTAPFSDTTGVSAMVRNITDYLPDPMDMPIDISEQASWLLEKMMAKKMKYRHNSWNDVLLDMDRVISGKFPASQPVPAGSSTIMRGTKRSENHRRNTERQHAASYSRTRSSTSSSLLFRIFLMFATILTIVLYVSWFITAY